MARDAWLPVGHELPDGAVARAVLEEGADWQVIQTQGNGRALIVREKLARRWFDSALVDPGSFSQFAFGDSILLSLSCGPGQVLGPVYACASPNSKSEALAFAVAIKCTREIDAASPLQDALYVERLSRLLPTYSISSQANDDVVLGYWLTGGANVSVKSFRRVRQMLTWLDASHLKDVVGAAGIDVDEMSVSTPRVVPRQKPDTSKRTHEIAGAATSDRPEKRFELAGRPELERFFNEHVIEIIRNRDRYRALGINFPSAIVLHGPPGCGKTYAVEQLVEFLGWPSFQIDASSVASPYIHETSRKVAEIFDQAMDSAPSVLVIDEMEAFLADREMGSGHHRVEEVAEFLRRIPEATKREVLIVAMTNRVDMIDPAILRRGRFDHVLSVDYASEVEVAALLTKLLAALPNDGSVDPVPLAQRLQGRPLSDVAFVVREGARLAARAGKSQLDQESLISALTDAPARSRDDGARRIGFV